jgi:hypothetical protein
MNDKERQKLIEHWMLLAKTVFVAEHNIIDEWKPKLQAARGCKTDLEVQQTVDAYLRAIATEILDNTNWQMEE